jgi:putative transposon-encoded protein
MELNNKEKKKINELIRSLTTINNIMKTLDVPDEILEKEIKPFGNASHIILPKGYTRKKAKIIVKR